MRHIMEQTLDRKMKYLKYHYNRISHKMNETLNYLLDTMSDIDSGPNAVNYLLTLDKKGNYGDRVHKHGLFENQ